MVLCLLFGLHTEQEIQIGILAPTDTMFNSITRKWGRARIGGPSMMSPEFTNSTEQTHTFLPNSLGGPATSSHTQVALSHRQWCLQDYGPIFYQIPGASPCVLGLWAAKREEG